MRAARLMHVAPWDVAARSAVWTEWALAAEAAEASAEARVRKEAEKRAKRRRGV